MSEKASSVDPLLCPLCQQQNLCANLGMAEGKKTCWCNDPNIQFPTALLEKIPSDKKGKACICQKCAQAFEMESGVNQYTLSPD